GVWQQRHHGHPGPARAGARAGARRAVGPAAAGGEHGRPEPGVNRRRADVGALRAAAPGLLSAGHGSQRIIAWNGNEVGKGRWPGWKGRGIDMNRSALPDEIDLYVWEGTSDLYVRAVRGLEGYDVNVVRADTGLAFPPPRAPQRVVVALVSVTVMGDARFSGHDWLPAHGIPVIWVAGEERGRDPRYYPPAYSHTLPLGF